MKKLILLTLFIYTLTSIANAQIFEPEGLNMPGGWDGWANPPTADVLRSSSISTGKITLITTGTRRYQTTIKVASSGGDLIGGTYEWLFTSGPSTNRYANKWANVTVSMNTLQNYTFNSGANNSITITNGKWYIVNFKDIGYASTEAIFMETSSEPVNISSVSDNYSGPGNAVTISITTSAAPATEEKIFVRYTTDGFSTSSFVQGTGSGTSWSAVIPSEGVTGTGNNQYYVLTTTVATPTHANADMQTIKFNNNSGTNYALPVQLVAFNAVAKKNGVELTWNTATEIDNYGFDIERADEGAGKWVKIGFVEGHGTTNVPKRYSFTDANVSGPVQYRLKQMDRDGTFEYSQVVTVNPFVASVLALKQNYPNPFNPTTTVSFTVPATGIATLKVFNVLGQEVATLFNGEAEAGRIYQARFNAEGLAGGMYFSRLEQSGSLKIMKMQLVK